MNESRIKVTYRAKVPEADAGALAARIAFEQSVELPQNFPLPPQIIATVLGRVDAVEADPASAAHYFIELSYAVQMANTQLSQLLNLVFGNVSIYRGVRLVGLELPSPFLKAFPGPAYGVAGLRKRLGVWQRPLLASALKPRGSSAEVLAALASEFALGGGDLIKDDQNLVDDFGAFKRRVTLCANAVDAANQRTGRACLYLPHLAAPAEDLPRFLDFVESSGLAGVLVCPMIVGLDLTRALINERGMLYMAHPAMTGSFINSADEGIAHEILLGTLFRLAGADISIFPDARGRFSFSHEECAGIVEKLRSPLGAAGVAWACPAGGMDRSQVGSLCDAYGPDSMFLIGGALLADPNGLLHATREFAGAIKAHCGESLGAPAAQLPTTLSANVYRALSGFNWEGRESSPYKDAGDLAFKGVRRVELAGRHGERTAFDLRYFEVSPGGFTSHEFHLHAHVVIGARGSGLVRLGDRSVSIDRDDVIYIEPLQSHQLINESDAPFGFYCIVDHRRDRPVRA